jgi:uncharacterized protein (DUF342 family)
MKGLELRPSAGIRQITLAIEPLLLDGPIDEKAIFQFINASNYSGFFQLDDNIVDLSTQLQNAFANNEMSPLEGIVAEARDADVLVSIASDQMSAELTLIAPYMGDTPSLDEIKGILAEQSVVRGVSSKIIKRMLSQLLDTEPGQSIVHLVAKGLPPKPGKNSYMKNIVVNALQRMLVPKESDEQINMRDFGDILCVSPDEILAKRMPPTKGRDGYTVGAKRLATVPGEWKSIVLGDNTYIDPSDHDVVRAKIAGLPRIVKSIVSVSDTFLSKGVNVATGNIKFEGSVIVEGDVTEKMRIVANGDVTINGFVESAYIEAGGDVIITQGASGKMQETDCEIVADGSVFIEHAQGISITTRGSVNIAKQLAYSNITCAKALVVGAIKKPQGKLFASTINCASSITAGHVGAISGSHLNIDYSDAYNKLQDHFDKINDHYETLISQNADHEIKISNINNRKDTARVKDKLASLNKELEYERVFVNWMRINRDELKEELENFDNKVLIKANHTLYNGVTVKINKRLWKASADQTRSQVLIEEGDWKQLPLR